MQVKFRDAASIGIIGGADGPTAIYVAHKSYPEIRAILFSIAVVLGLILFLKKRKKAAKKR